MAISSKAIMEVLALSGDERRILGDALQDENITTAHGLGEMLEKMCRVEARKQGAENLEQAEALKKIPAGVWAAHALVELSELIYDLSVIRDGAVATELSADADSYAEEGRYKMLVAAVDNIADKMMEITTNEASADVLRIVAAETEKPAEE